MDRVKASCTRWTSRHRRNLSAASIRRDVSVSGERKRWDLRAVEFAGRKEERCCDERLDEGNGGRAMTGTCGLSFSTREVSKWVGEVVVRMIKAV